MSDLVDVCKKKLDFITQNFTDRTGFFASSASKLFGTTSGNAAVTNLLSYSSFVTAYLPNNTVVSASTPWHTAVNANVRVKVGTSFVTLGSAASSPGATLTLNFSKMPFWTTPAMAPLNALLNHLTILYNILEPAAFEDYRSGTWSVDAYDLNTAGTGASQVSSAGGAVDKVAEASLALFGNSNLNALTTDKNDITMIRRLLLTHINIAHIHIALTFLASASTANASSSDVDVRSANKTAAENVAKIAFAQLTTINEAVNSVNTATDFDKLITSLQDRMRETQTNRETVNDLDRKIKDLKRILARDKEVMADENNQNSKSGRLWTASAVVFVGVAVACGVAGVAPLPEASRTALAGIAFGIAAVGTVVLTIVSRNIIHENFAVEQDASSPLSTSVLVWTAANVLDSTAADTYKRVALVELSSALSNTIYVGLMLQTYSGYGNFNLSMKREIHHFDGVNFQMNQTHLQVYAEHRATNLKTKLDLNAMRTLLSLSLILSLATWLIVAFPSVGTVVFTVAALAVVVTLWMYVFVRAMYVRTDPSKVYHGQPDLKQLR